MTGMSRSDGDWIWIEHQKCPGHVSNFVSLGRDTLAPSIEAHATCTAGRVAAATDEKKARGQAYVPIETVLYGPRPSDLLGFRDGHKVLAPVPFLLMKCYDQSKWIK